MIRLVMETAFELSIVAIVNMRTVDWGTSFPAEKYSTALSIISLILLGVLTLFFSVFNWLNFSKLKETSFKNKHRASLEGTRVDVTTPPKSILAYPAIFFARRIIFALSAVYLGHFLWAQLLIQMTIVLIVAGYLGAYKPLDSPFANRIEIMNECTILVLTYGQMHFTDYVPEPETREIFGYIYIVVVLANTTVHFVILTRDSCIKGKFACKRCKYWCKSAKIRCLKWWNQRG